MGRLSVVSLGLALSALMLQGVHANNDITTKAMRNVCLVYYQVRGHM